MLVQITFWPDQNNAPVIDTYECRSKEDEESIPYGSYHNIISVTEVEL